MAVHGTSVGVRRGAPNVLCAQPLGDREVEALAESGPHCGLWSGSKLRRVVDIGRQRETAGDGGSLLLRVLRASRHGQETLEATASKRK